MAILREANSQLVAQFSTPYLGTFSSNAAHEVPGNGLYSSNNVYVRKGKLRCRPGFTLLNNTNFNEPVLCASLAVTPIDNRILAITKTGLFEQGQDEDSFTKTTTIEMANNNDAVIDIVFLETSGTYVGIITSEGYKPKQWNNLTSVTQDISFTGVTPYAKSVCIASRRAIYLEPPHTIRWSKVFDFSNIPANAYNKIAQTNDIGICVRSLSTLSYVVYKERSIYPVRSQAGNDENAFGFGEPIKVEGPAGIKAIVDVGGTHIYMTRNGRIGTFDGSNYPQWIADGVWLFLQEDINPEFAYKIHGIYDHRLHTVTFFYPRGRSSNLTGMVIVNLPFEGNTLDQQKTPHTFIGESGIPVSASCEMRFKKTINRSILFASPSFGFNPYIFDEKSSMDNDQLFPWEFQTGLQAMPEAKQMLVSVESYLERGVNYGSVKLDPVVADTLENEGGEVLTGRTQNIDLSTKPKTSYQSFGIQYRYFGLKYSGISSDNLRWSGATVYGVES